MQAPSSHDKTLMQDLGLPTLIAVMAGDDKRIYDVAQHTLLASLTDIDTILYRQEILKDCFKNEQVVRDMYNLAVETLESERKNFLGIAFRYPHAILYRSVEVLQMLAGMLRRLKAIADQDGVGFDSEGFRTLFTMLRSELDHDYFAAIQYHLKELKFGHGVLISAQLGEGNKGTDYVLRKRNPPQGSWVRRAFTRPPSYSYTVHERDEAGARALGELRDRGINLVANALAQSTDHILSFFTMLRNELAFYVGCLNLRQRLSSRSLALCFPQPIVLSHRALSATGLYDVCLALNLSGGIVDNDIRGDGRDLVIITGANQGGKSTFLRSIGLSQVMMQCGMFVPAMAFRANVFSRIFTHFKREEDATMESGKFDEELKRMNEIVEDVTPDCLVLFNESFAATNEREGSEIARQITSALIESRVKVAFVTHQYEFARQFHARNLPKALFVRAERRDGGARTFKVVEAPPLPTSFGEDLYREIFLGQPLAAKENAMALQDAPKP